MSALYRSRYYSVALIICVIITLQFSHAGLCAEKPARVELTILHTNDIHGHLFPFDYDDMGNYLMDVGGAARRATLIRQIKSTAGNPVLVMDAGDVFQRGPLADQFGAPDFKVMNAIPYDVMTLGNNEFKGAPGAQARQVLLDRIKDAKFPIVSANVYDRSSGKLLVDPYEIFDVGGIKVGIIGLLTARDQKLPQTQWVRVDDPIATMKAILPEVRAKADFIVALTHLGVAQDIELASVVGGIDVIIGGDSHTWLFRPIFVKSSEPVPGWAVGGTIICQDGEWGKSLGRLDLTLRPAEGHAYKPSSYSAKLIDVDSSIKPANDITAIIDAAAKPYMVKIGNLTAPISEKDAPSWVAARMRTAAGAQVAVEPAENIENGLKSGNVTMLDIRAMFSFTNNVAKLTVSGKQLKSFILSYVDPGLSGAELRDGDLYVGGDKASPAQTYTLAVEDYYALHSASLAGTPVHSIGKSTVDIVAMYLSTR